MKFLSDTQGNRSKKKVIPLQNNQVLSTKKSGCGYKAIFFMGNYQEAKNEIAIPTAKDPIKDRAPLVMLAFSATHLFSV